MNVISVEFMCILKDTLPRNDHYTTLYYTNLINCIL